MAYKKFYIRFLEQTIEQKKKINPRFSTRALAKKTGIDAGTFAQILSEKRIPTQNQVDKIINALKPTQETSKSFRRSVEIAKSNLTTVANQAKKLIDLGVEHADLFDFNHFLVHALLSIKKLHHTKESICQRTLLDSNLVTKILQNLLNAKVIEYDNEKNCYYFVRRYSNEFKLPKKIQMKKIHLHSIPYLQDSLENGNFSDSVHATLNIPMTKINLPKYRTILYDFYDKLAALCEEETDTADSVYALGLYLFPIIKENI